jgi:predicted DNA-binding ribbon-helix-helix protein
MGIPTSPRTILVAGRRTTVRLEDALWEALEDIADRKDVSRNELITEISNKQDLRGLTTSIRIYIVEFYRDLADRPAKASALRTRRSPS